MDTESLRPHLLIALPQVFCFKSLFIQSVDSVLNKLGDTDISLISDSAGQARRILEAKGITPCEVRISAKLDAKSAQKKYTHFLVFWDGEEQTNLIYFAKLFKKPIRIVPVKITKVKNVDHNEEFDVYIGRKTPWGNPFPIRHGEEGQTRTEVIEKYKHYFYAEIVSSPEKLKRLLSLKGLRLGCHCKPLPCHGDVIANFLNSYEEADDLEN